MTTFDVLKKLKSMFFETLKLLEKKKSMKYKVQTSLNSAINVTLTAVQFTNCSLTS